MRKFKLPGRIKSVSDLLTTDDLKAVVDNLIKCAPDIDQLLIIARDREGYLRYDSNLALSNVGRGMMMVLLKQFELYLTSAEWEGDNDDDGGDAAE